MEKFDLLNKEYDLAYNSYQFYTNSKTTLVRVFAAIIIAFITFLVKGELPESLYLLVAFILVGYLFYHNWMTHKQISSWLLWQYVEKKTNVFLKEKGEKKYRVDSAEKINKLLFGTKKVTSANRMLNIIYIILILIVFEGSLLKGALDITNDVRHIILIHVPFYLLLFLYLRLSRLQNISRKEIHKEMMMFNEYNIGKEKNSNEEKNS